MSDPSEMPEVQGVSDKSTSAGPDWAVIGPKGSGKTSFLCSIPQALKSDFEGVDSIYREKVVNVIASQSEKLQTRTGKFLRHISEEGEFSGDERVTDYALTLDVTYDGFWKKKRKPYDFAIVDGPGGSMHFAAEEGATESMATSEMKQHVDKAGSILTCWPAMGSNDPSRNQNFAQNLHAQLNLQPDLKKCHILVALTQYDRAFSAKGVSAFDEATDPQVALAIIRNSLRGTELISKLRDVADKGGKVSLCPCSAYGFIPSNGAANFDREDPKSPMLATNSKYYGDEWIQHWQPLGIADIMIHACIPDATVPKGGLIFDWTKVDGAAA